MIFDLDGTLVQTEKLKALSYARAAVELCPRTIREGEVIEAFKEVVGLPRREVAQALVRRFDLGARAEQRMPEFGVSAPWQAFAQVRLQHYEHLLADPAVIRDNQWPYNRVVLEQARAAGCATGLATMSHCMQATRVLSILELDRAFDFVATRDDVEHGKPDPEIYHLVAGELKVTADRCLVLEDSPSGIKAAVDAGMWCIGVTTPFTRDGVHAQGLLDPRWIVDDSDAVLETVREMINERQMD